MPRLRIVLPTALLVAAVSFPLGVLASHQFSDVPTSSVYHADIDALVAAGVTSGCGGGAYCPKAYVTREQMAAFMNRLGALAPGKTPVVNAARVDGKDVVLGAGDVVNIQQGPWFAGGSSPVATMHYFDVDTVTRTDPGAGNGVVVLQLAGPTSIDGVTYGLKSVQVCHSDAFNVSITNTAIWRSAGFDDAEQVLNDTTDRSLSSPGCYQLTDTTPNVKAGGIHVALDLSFASGDGIAWLGNITSTWTATTLP